ncbi:hypothetical protein Pmani_003162 [Petrolisthes manimaculis]|uniref:Integrase catalytic domain-containing protein n=1 Tax=Petrolisthes manimaculis TaxID=1843537 RepID=A0AAE1UIR1_9EUCA|nr:hypothetical protein Pmani_003162 [Petrolisthes manimaculis]
MKEVSIHRCAGIVTATDTVSCVSGEASQKAYCTAIYIVQGEEAHLLASKGRLAPRSQVLSIPRLELMASVIGVKLMHTILQSLSLQHPKILYYTNSTDVLHWIKTPLKLFIQNRVSSIRRLSTSQQRHYKDIAAIGGRRRRYRGLPYHSPGGQLPDFRTEFSRSFAKIGIDYFGPIYVDAGETKVWGLLATMQLHVLSTWKLLGLKSVKDLQLALRRFFAQRGTPPLIVSDNAKSFWKLSDLLPPTEHWRCIPETSPWWGGFWKRLVASVKKLLKVTLHQCHHSFEELATTFYELVFHLNLRFLTSNDGDCVLTPAHFLFGVISIPRVVLPTVDPSATFDRTWKNRKRVADHLNRR